ncbi:HD-GYP domain-containing protein [Clostridium sp. Cult2]|uniref:HD-GYP domain-containing protein n=1 Tax=Clostridium sp. Cult2 TaxID=2079003 RepID=UPI001F42C048|nr:HD-GYP domain-containing protein [Clostridium sp. Cult2]MCF6464481.1 HD-GYP domain-containing protein [Clostridium sp. Cult2]
METKPLFLTEKVIDEILIEDIFDDEGNILMGKNAIINEYAFHFLAKSKVKRVPIYPSMKDNYSSGSFNLPLFHKENILALQDIVTRLAAGRGVDPNELGRVSETLSLEVNRNRQMIGQTGRIKDTDEYTYNHSINVAIYSLYIGKLIGLDNERIKELCQAALLHDIGKANVPKNILNKKGKLTEEEFRIVKKHTIDGYLLSKRIPFLKEEVREAILSHHEREDGSGYPRGIKGRKINLYARILAIADVYDALTSERVYKEKSTPFEAIEEFYNMGINKFSKPILNIFFKNTFQLYVNSKVKLTDGRIGRIQFIHPKKPTKPVIRVDGEHINLSKCLFLKIEEVIG